jgi:hypothetical protein
VQTEAYGEAVDGGAAGYVIAGTDGVYTSTDGLAWKPVDLKAAVFKGYKGIQSGVAFLGGFLVAGETQFQDPTCGGSSDAVVTASMWSSTDGSSWNRVKLPNAPSGPETEIDVCHFGGDLLVAQGASAKGGFLLTSTDGVTWKSRPDTDLGLCPNAPDGLDIFETVGSRTLVMSNASEDSTSVYELHGDATMSKLAQSGAVPPHVGDYGAVFGPAGIIVAEDDGNTYVGVPVAG